MKMPALTNVNCSRGAPMGRQSAHSELTQYAGKFNLAAVPLSPCGAYDSGGAYWGCGSPQHGYMYRAYCLEHDEVSGEDFLVDWFIRAKHRHHAKQLVLEKYPAAKFYR